MTISIVAAARPNFTKVAPVVASLTDRATTDLVHTGQHYDVAMSRAFFDDLGLREPDVNLGIGSGSHAEQTAGAMVAYEKRLTATRPAAVVVVGDVNSTLACALAAAKLCIPVAHVEAGLRSHDWSMPEEINRVLTDRLSHWLFTPSADADENLLLEGIDPDRIHLVGNTVARIWRDHNLKPWKVDTFKISTDPNFEEKLVDVVGLYLNPPERAVVLSFDEKTQVQALDRTQPSLPLKPGRAGTMTHDYKRNGTTDLFAALNVATGEVIYDTKRRHTANEVLGFFKLIDRHVPRHLDIHVVLDNLSAHKAPTVTEWLAHPNRDRWHLHFTPTSSSWLNLIEGWFKQLTERRLRRGTFTSVDALIEAITLWAEHWNNNPQPFTWHKTAEEIIAKVRRGRAALTHQTKSATHH